MEKVYIEIKRWFSDNKEKIIFVFGTVFIIGLICHAYGFLTNTANHDTLNAFYATGIEDRWKVGLGRFFVPYYRRWFRGGLTLPWLIGILGLFFVAIAVHLILEIFEIESKLLIILIAGIMVSNITILSQIATYIFEFDYNMFSMLCSVTAVYIWKKYDRWSLYAVASVLVTISLGIYQSYIAVTVTCIIFDSIMQLMKAVDAKKVFIKGLKAIAFIAVGIVIYMAAYKLFLNIYHVTAAARTNVFNFLNTEQGIVEYFLMLIISTYEKFFEYLIYYYKIHTTCILFVLLFIAVISLIIRLIKDKNISVLGKLLVMVLLPSLPLAMNMTYITSKGESSHDLTMYAVWMIYVLLIIYFNWMVNVKKSKLNIYLKGLTLFLVCSCIFNNFIFSNTAYLKKEVEKEAVLSIMTRVVDRMEQYDGYIASETPVVFVGISNLPKDLPGTDSVRPMVGLGNRSPITYDLAMEEFNFYKAYFTYVMNYPINIADVDTINEIKSKDYVKTMPSFPSKGSVTMIDGVMIVKMG